MGKENTIMAKLKNNKRILASLLVNIILFIAIIALILSNFNEKDKGDEIEGVWYDTSVLKSELTIGSSDVIFNSVFYSYSGVIDKEKQEIILNEEDKECIYFYKLIGDKFVLEPKQDGDTFTFKREKPEVASTKEKTETSTEKDLSSAKTSKKELSESKTSTELQMISDSSMITIELDNDNRIIYITNKTDKKISVGSGVAWLDHGFLTIDGISINPTDWNLAYDLAPNQKKGNPIPTSFLLDDFEDWDNNKLNIDYSQSHTFVSEIQVWTFDDEGKNGQKLETLTIEYTVGNNK
ncbi:hypothetical protein M2139_001327 [Enterococcus sp. PF1-24]|uniref:hypothetical protein n=1 Tax=unclassified Enterococcus TaxID=2608891 RepID=UPI0024733D7F|nr:MULTISPECIES: hypothetical protein [unclassified Enterococcus]MDH6364368.1 hypothetical protein [Enterococcus sp. PFB1-1]MDH6401443.1 hypothetical protein [Enterococcus sp. PF1-24]